MPTVSLGLIYNHQFLGNVSRLTHLYEKRFDHVHHLMPFSDSNPACGLIGVSEASKHFQGHIAQAWCRMREDDSDFYLFVGDDVMLAPGLTCDTVPEKLGVAGDRSFIKEWRPLHNVSASWHHLLHSFRPLTVNVPSVEWDRVLPSYDEARKRLERHGYVDGAITSKNLFTAPPVPHASWSRSTWLKVALQIVHARGRWELPFPMVFGYADVVCVPRAAMPEFARLCGVFASVGVFAEAALPTSLLLASSNISTASSVGVTGIEFWTQTEVQMFGERYRWSLDELLSRGFEVADWYHPVKLSLWS